ncbi:MAG: hypothetical protein WA005_10260, partial [Candidatus Binataceae bacterium]
RRLARMFDPRELAALLRMAERGINAPLTTSVGRLFDAVAALAGVRERASFEGQAAMELEYAIGGRPQAQGAYPIALKGASPIVGDWAPLIEALLEDLERRVAPALISARFHNALVRFALEVARRVGCRQVVLGGGCFQNAYLALRLRAGLIAAGCEVFCPRLVPPNDAAIALGQILVARHLMEKL